MRRAFPAGSAMRAARRSGPPTRRAANEVDVSGAKPWRQKGGTGRAVRLQVHRRLRGWLGVVFGTKTRDYSNESGKSVRRHRFSKSAERTHHRGMF